MVSSRSARRVIHNDQIRYRICYCNYVTCSFESLGKSNPDIITIDNITLILPIIDCSVATNNPTPALQRKRGVKHIFNNPNPSCKCALYVLGSQLSLWV